MQIIRLFLLEIFIFVYSISFGQTKLDVINVMQSGCNKDADIFRVQNQIISQSHRNDTFEIRVGMVTNCAGITNLQAEYVNDTIYFHFEQGQIEYDTITKRGKTEIRQLRRMLSCDCCFEFRFIAFKVPQQPKVVNINGSKFDFYSDRYRIYPIKFDIFQSDTINFIDKYGLKQGRWNKIENDFEIDSLENYIFEAFYVENRIKTENLKIYFPSGKLKMLKLKTDFDRYRKTNYYENGQIESEIINNEYELGLVSYSFYEDGSVHEIRNEREDFTTNQIFYKNGKLEKITNKLIWQQFYPNGNIKYERLYSRGKDNVWAKYFYESGEIMSIYYLKTSKNNQSKIKRWQKFYDKKGNRVGKSDLIQKGFKEILDL